MEKEKLNDLLEFALKASLEAGRQILDIYSSKDFEVEYKKDESPLTIADKKANSVICEILQKTGLPILSEESKEIAFSKRKNWQTFWMVDPLDGTKEFIKRNGEFTVNIALIENKRPILGVVFSPVLKKLYYGCCKKSFLSENIDISLKDDFLLTDIHQNSLSLPLEKSRSNFVIVASRSHLSDETKAFIETVKKEKGEVEIRSIGSSLKLCLVAEGSADTYPRFGPTMEWDTAAGHAVVIAAGGSIEQIIQKSPLIYNKENLLNPWFIVNK